MKYLLSKKIKESLNDVNGFMSGGGNSNPDGGADAGGFDCGFSNSFNACSFCTKYWGA